MARPGSTLRRFCRAVQHFRTDGEGPEVLLASVGRELLHRARLPLSAAPAPLLREVLPPHRLAEWRAFCDQWDWSLDETMPESVTPAALGALLESSLDRKGDGAYYTSPDVALYICRNTLLPALMPVLPPDALALAAEGPERCLPRSLREPGLLLRETEEERAARHSRRDRLVDLLRTEPPPTTGDWIAHNLDLGALLTFWLNVTGRDEIAAFHHRLRSLRVLDPTCGSGDFLLAALALLWPLEWQCAHRLARRRSLPEPGALCGVDRTPLAIEVCRLRLHFRLLRDGHVDPLPPDWPDLRVADALRAGHPSGWPEDFAPGTFDCVIGNPPYVAAEDAGAPAPERFRTRSCPNVYAWVVERGLEALRPEGRFGMIVPVSAVSGREYRPLAELLATREQWVSTYSNRPAKLFEGVEQRVAILLAGPAAGPERNREGEAPAEPLWSAAARRGFRTRGRPFPPPPAGAQTGGLERPVWASAYQHWYEAERPYLFDRLTYVEASRWDETGMPVKTGSPLAERVFRKLIAHRGRLEELARPGPCAVWLHDGPTYWVRALPFRPEGGDRHPLHYHCIPAADQAQARVLSAVLSSSTFYFFFKQVSNCRDLGQFYWRRFPIDPLPSYLETRLAALGEELEVRLRETAALRRRVYPRGSVTYREYYPASGKDIIDRIDVLLAIHYGLDAEELAFIQNYDRKYRTGR